MEININCDLGESSNLHSTKNDPLLLNIVNSANIACGYHAGDKATMGKTIEISKKNKVSIGAHPSFNDKENFGFKLKYIGKEVIRTKFGKVKTLKFRPYVMAGRVFKEEESLTLWVSNDKNRIPLRIKADLAIGSLRADLDAFKGLKHSFKILVDN